MPDVDLSGMWTGTYSGDPPDIPGNGFTARLIDAGGRISGDIVEPDDDSDSGMLHAEVRGMVAGGDVTFLKLYDGESHTAHGVDYRGRLSADCCLIAGEWAFGRYSGVFEMRREASRAESRRKDARIAEPVGRSGR